MQAMIVRRKLQVWNMDERTDGFAVTGAHVQTLTLQFSPSLFCHLVVST